MRPAILSVPKCEFLYCVESNWPREDWAAIVLQMRSLARPHHRHNHRIGNSRGFQHDLVHASGCHSKTWENSDALLLYTRKRLAQPKPDKPSEQREQRENQQPSEQWPKPASLWFGLFAFGTPFQRTTSVRGFRLLHVILVAVTCGQHLDFCDVNRFLVSIYVGLHLHVVPFVTLQCLGIVYRPRF